jgi:anti-anti-sigma factor
MRFNYVREEDKLVFSFSGRLDTSTCEEIREGVLGRISELLEGEEAGPDPLRVFFDLAGVDYIASGFLRICSAVAGKVDRTNLVVINSSPFVRKVFVMAGFDRIIGVE